jgi:hypothetical protein
MHFVQSEQYWRDRWERDYVPPPYKVKRKQQPAPVQQEQKRNRIAPALITIMRKVQAGEEITVEDLQKFVEEMKQFYAENVPAVPLDR